MIQIAKFYCNQQRLSDKVNRQGVTKNKYLVQYVQHQEVTMIHEHHLRNGNLPSFKQTKLFFNTVDNKVGFIENKIKQAQNQQRTF